MLVAWGEDLVRGCSGASSVGAGGGSCVVGGHSGTGSVSADGGCGGSCVVGGHSGAGLVSTGEASCRIVSGMLVSVVVGRMGVGPAGASLSKSITCTPGGGAFVFAFFRL